MTRFWRGCLIIIGAELALVGLLLLAPGAGHSPLFYTQLPAFLMAARLDPAVGSCIPCAPSAWLVGVTSQVLLLIAIWALAERLFRARVQAGP
jgi:hypothetical protein